jgi:hypothetical protein
VGMYDPTSLVRLPVLLADGTATGDALELTIVEVH